MGILFEDCNLLSEEKTCDGVLSAAGSSHSRRKLSTFEKRFSDFEIEKLAFPVPKAAVEPP